MDHFEESAGEEYALRSSTSPTTSTTDSFIRRIKFGARYADRDQEVRYTTYNWGALSEVWSGSAGFMDQVGADQHRILRLRQLLPWPDLRARSGGYYYTGDLIGGL